MRRIGQQALAVLMVLAGALAGLGPLTPERALAVTPCTLYGATGGNVASNLYTLNAANGATTPGPLTAPGVALTGLAVHPHTGILYGATSSNTNPS